MNRRRSNRVVNATQGTAAGESRSGGWQPARGTGLLPATSEYGHLGSGLCHHDDLCGLTSALIVRKGSSLDWQHLTLPSILYFNTVLLLGSSVALEIARRRVAAFMGGIAIPRESPARWLYITLVFGLLFVIGQYVAWARLSAEGLYLATNPSSSFFYVLTATHALHVLGGLGGLLYVIGKLRKSELRRSTLDAASRYWHFVDVLWVYLLFLLWMKL